MTAPSSSTVRELEEKLRQMNEVMEVLSQRAEDLAETALSLYSRISELEARVQAAEARAEALERGLERLELACDHVAGSRTQAVYLAMIESGQKDDLLHLDNARFAARRLLAASALAQAGAGGEGV